MSGPIVITGCGVVSSIGVGWKPFGEALAEGRCGIGEIVSFDSSDTGRERAAEIHDFDSAPWLRSPKNYLDRQSALAFAAAEMAARASGIALPDLTKGHGLALGSMAGNAASLAAFHAKLVEKGPKFAPPFLFPHTYYNTTAGLLSIEYGLNGPHAQFCSGSAAGLEAVACAVAALQRGRAEWMLSGGVDAFSELSFRAALARGWLSPLDGKEERMAPLAADRNGAILGEGAALFALEPLDQCRVRGGASLAAVFGCGIASQPERAMRQAIAGAGIKGEAISAVFSSAGGYPREDAEEARAIAAAVRPEVPIVALKALVGETLGGGGALNLAAALWSLGSGRLPQCVLSGGRAEAGNIFLVNAGSPGEGRWVTLLLGRA